MDLLLNEVSASEKTTKVNEEFPKSVRAQSAFVAKSRYPLQWAMCWKCDLIAPKCRNFTFPDWMETSLEPFPPAIEPSEMISPLSQQKEVHTFLPLSEQHRSTKTRPAGLPPGAMWPPRPVRLAPTQKFLAH